MPGPLTKQVAAILKDAASGITQKQLGDMVGISQPQMSKYLSGTRVLDIEELDAICRVLGLKAADVLRDADAARAPKQP